MYTMYALFPIKKIERYIQAITFENYLENESVENVIRMHGINPCFLDKTNTIHPFDILIHNNEWKKIEDINFIELFRNQKDVYLVEITLPLCEIFIPLTRAFNSRFELMPMEWLKTYVTTICEDVMGEQNRLSLEEFCELQQIPDEDVDNMFVALVEKYVFACDMILGDQVKSIKLIPNPLI